MADKVELPPARVVRGVRSLRLQTPPRRVPARLWLRLVFDARGAQAVWCLLLFVVWLSVLTLPKDRWNRVFDARAEAKITRVYDTIRDGDRETRIEYRFRDARGREYVNYGLKDSFTPGVGASYDVRYVSDEPEYSELITPGVESRYVSPATGLVGLGSLALATLVLLVAQLFRTRRDLALLRRGREATARLMQRRMVPWGQGEIPCLTFEYEIDTTTHRFEVRTHDTRCLEDDPVEPIVYDPARPGHAVTLDNLPGSPVIVDDELRDRGRMLWHLLVAPAAVLAGIATLLILYYV